MNPVTKSYIALAIMFGCFVVLYPKVFHPWIKIIFGLNQKPEQQDPPFHPRERAMPGIHNRDPAGPQNRMHPGARFHDDAAAKRQGSSSKGGMSSFMLPVYAIGIMLYLGYTLLKIWSKKNNQNESAEDWMTAQRRRGAQVPRNNEQPPAPNAASPQPAAQPVADSMDKSSDSLAKMLRSADFDSMSYAELRALRQRLEDTESRMTNLLKEVGAATKAAESIVAATASETSRADTAGNSKSARKSRSSAASNSDQQSSEPESDTCRKSEGESETHRNEAEVNAEAEVEAESEGDKGEESVAGAKANAKNKKKKKKKQKNAAKKEEAEAAEEKQPQQTVRKRIAGKLEQAVANH